MQGLPHQFGTLTPSAGGNCRSRVTNMSYLALAMLL